MQLQAESVGGAERQISVPDSQVAIVGEAPPPVAIGETARAQRPDEDRQATQERARNPWWLRIGTLAALGLALAAIVPTVGDFGLTWDEPAYRYSQLLSVQWWEQLRDAPSCKERP